jgi:flagellin
MTDGTAPFLSLRNKNAATTQRAFEKLSSGRRINSAADDPAGLAIVSKLQFSIDTLGQVSRNINDATSRIQLTDGVLEQVGQISNRLSELAAQAANGTVSDAQRAATQEEFSQLTQEISRIAESTEFNGVKLFNGSAITTQVGTDASPDSQITTPGIDLKALVGSLSSQSIASQSGAQTALEQVTAFADQVGANRGTLGAVANRLGAARNVAEVKRENSIAAQARIQDVDLAEETARLVSGQIRQRSEVALQAIGNIDRGKVFSLLGGRR